MNDVPHSQVVSALFLALISNNNEGAWSATILKIEEFFYSIHLFLYQYTVVNRHFLSEELELDLSHGACTLNISRIQITSPSTSTHVFKYRKSNGGDRTCYHIYFFVMNCFVLSNSKEALNYFVFNCLPRYWRGRVISRFKSYSNIIWNKNLQNSFSNSLTCLSNPQLIFFSNTYTTSFTTSSRKRILYIFWWWHSTKKA